MAWPAARPVSSKSAFAKDGATLKTLHEAAAALRQRAAWDHLERVLKLTADFARDRAWHWAHATRRRGRSYSRKERFLRRVCAS